METVDALKSNSKELKPCQKRRIGEQDDRISNLHDDVIHRIFSFVSTIDVVRTCVLAKRWRYLWTQTPTLDFDENLFPIANRENSFVHFVDRVQSLYKVPNIERYRLLVQSANNAHFADTWVHFAVRMNVKELNLEMLGYGPFEMPCCGSVRVLILKLRNGNLILPNSGSFSSLETLSLSNARLTDDVILDMISLRCPCLKSLCLENCTGLYHLNISCPLLEVLKIKRCYGLDQLDVYAEALQHLCVHDSFTYESGTVKISAQSLQTFKWLDYIVGNFSIENFTSLKAAHISLVIHYDPKNFETYLKTARNFLNRLACAGSLQVEIPCFWGLSTQKDLLEGLSNPQCNIKHLTLLVGHDDYVFRGISYLIKSCPNLETLGIVTVDEQTNEVLNNEFPETYLHDKEHWNYQRIPLDHLWEAKVCGFRGEEYEIEFLKYLLEHGVVLKRMIVRLSGEVFLDENMKIEIAEMLMKLKRASLDATILVC